MSDLRRAPSSVGGSSRAKLMVSMAMGSKGGGKGGGKAARTPHPGGLPVVYTRKPKRNSEEADVYSSMQCTPKKQCLPATTPLAATAGTARPFGVARVGGPPSAGALPLVQQRPLKDVTCTHLASCYTDRQQSQRWREARLEEEERRRALRSGGSGGGGGGGRAARLPAGMLNLGNTCYMNAVLQVLLSLPCFVADLKAGRQALEGGGGQPLSPTGVYAALLECVAAKDSLAWGRSYITPASLKKALDARSAAFQGAFQQDAHELLCSLLGLLQSEVLAREVGRLGRSRVRISETADPAARTFSFAVQHELECGACGRRSRVVEEYMHLSLELPEPQASSARCRGLGASLPGSAAAACSVPSLLREYFQDEHVEKSCEGCGGANTRHRLRHTIRRLPRVLVLHMKRFKVAWSAEQQRPVCQKLHTAVEMPETLGLDAFLAPGALPPLAGAAAAEGGKENDPQQANPEAAGHLPGVLAQQQQPQQQARRLGSLQPRSGVRFYGGGAGMGSPVATGALLSPVRGPAASPFLRRRDTPMAFKGASAARDDEDAQLQQALALSMLEAGPAQPQQQQPQQQEQQGAAPSFLRLRRQSAEQGEVQLGSPGSGAAAQGLLPAEVEATAQLAAGPAGDSASHGGGLKDRWFMGGWGKSGGGDSSAHKTPQQAEDEELQRVLELSRQEEEQRQAAASSGAAGAAGAAGEAADADLLRALELSMQDAGGAAAAAGTPDAGGPQAEPAAQQQQQQQQQQQAPGRENSGYLSLFDGILHGSQDAGSPAAAGEQQAGAAPGSGDQDQAGSEPAAEAAAAAAPACLQAQIVEDDALLPEGGPAGEQAAGGSPGGAAAGGEEAPAAAPAPGAKPPRYRLHASINHQGPAASCGHFTADVCDPATRAWHRLDDSVASRISAGEARSGAKQRECYLLFYVAA